MVTPVDQAALYPLTADPGRGGNGAQPLIPGAKPDDGFKLFGNDLAARTHRDLVEHLGNLAHQLVQFLGMTTHSVDLGQSFPMDTLQTLILRLGRVRVF